MVGMSTCTGQSLVHPLQARHRSSASWTSSDCQPSVITNQLKILLQMDPDNRHRKRLEKQIKGL